MGGEFGPYRQSERGEVYREYARILMKNGRAYPCYCTEEELAAEAEETEDGRTVHRYSGRCRDLTEEDRRERERAGRSFSVRVAVPADADIKVIEEVRGAITFPRHDIDDFIILRSDGRPTYNFAVVVDDAAMEITHVIRGAGHVSNTPKQAVLFDALGLERPRFVHLPTVLSPDGGRLSKREDAAAVASLREEGYLPDAVVNYLSLLGWSSPTEDEYLSRERLIGEISVDRLGASDTTFDPEKLRWLSGKHFQAMEPNARIEAVRSHLSPRRSGLDDGQLRRALDLLAQRVQTLTEVDGILALVHPDEERLEEAWKTSESERDSTSVLRIVRAKLADLSEWTPESASEAVREGGREAGAKGRDLFHPVRLALTAEIRGPDLGGILYSLGRDEALRRLTRALAEA